MTDAVIHHFSAGGVYAREHLASAGTEVQKHVHDYDHLSYLAAGRVVLEVDGELDVLDAPCMFEVKAGKEHRITAVTDIVWLCIHSEVLADPDIKGN